MKKEATATNSVFRNLSCVHQMCFIKKLFKKKKLFKHTYTHTTGLLVIRNAATITGTETEKMAM